MDLKQRIEELTEVSESLKRLQKLNAEVEQYKVQIEEAMKRVKVDGEGKIVDDNDRIFVDRLNHLREQAEKRVTEEATKFNSTKEKAVETLRDEVDAELSTYRMAGERGYETQSEAMDRVGNPYMTGKNEVEMKNYERQMRISRAQEAKEKNEAALAEIEKNIAEAIEAKDFPSLEILNEKKAGLMTDIQIAESVIASMSAPYKAIEDNEAEYTAVYDIWKSMEEILDPQKQDAVVSLDSIQATIAALHELEEIQEASIPVETRYKEMQDKAKELSDQKTETKETIDRLKKLLAEGKIGKDYVDSTNARVAELEQEMKDIEAQEQENADKMKKLEEEHGLKPEGRDEGDGKGKGEGEGDGKGKGEGEGKGKDDGQGDGGKPKTDIDKINELLGKKDAIESAIKAKETEMKEIMARMNDTSIDKELSKELSSRHAQLRTELIKLGTERRTVESSIKSLEEAIAAREAAAKGQGDDASKGGDGKGKGDDKPVPVVGDAYYGSLSPWGKYKMKKEAFQLSEGVKGVSLWRKALLMLPSNKYSAMAGRMLENGEIKPLPSDVNMLEEAAKQEREEAEKRAAAEAAAAKKDPHDDAYRAPEAKKDQPVQDPLKPVPGAREATDEASRKAADKAKQGQQPEQSQPKKDDAQR